MTRRTVAIIIVGVLAMLGALILPRTRPTADAANRILNQYRAAEAPMLRLPPDASWQRVDYFLGKLKAIDTDDAPEDVQRAMTVMVSAVEANMHVRRVGGDTAAANERVATAKKDLLRALDRWRGQPF